MLKFVTLTKILLDFKGGMLFRALVVFHKDMFGWVVLWYLLHKFLTERNVILRPRSFSSGYVWVSGTFVLITPVSDRKNAILGSCLFPYGYVHQ